MDFSKVRAVHVRALKHLAALQAAKTFEDYEAQYELLLHDIQLIWNKTLNTLKNHPRKSPLLSKYRAERESDELLTYVRAARNCQEHTIAEVNRREPGSVFIVTQDGRIERFDPEALKESGAVHVGSPIVTMAATTSRAVPIAVTDQRSGKVYNPPATHSGKAILMRSIEDWIGLCLSYYGRMLHDLEQNA